MEGLLLRPLWGVVSDYFEPGERWYYAGVPAFGIKAGGAAPALPDALITCGHLPALAAWLEGVPRPRRKKAIHRNTISLMIQFDRAEMLEYVRRRYPKCLKRYYEIADRRGLRYAAVFGALETLRWEQRYGYAPWNTSTAAMLAKHGYLTALQQVRQASPPCPWDHRSLTHAVAGDQVEVVEWIKTTDLDVSGIDIGSHIYTRDMFRLFTNEVDHKQVLLNALNKGSLEFVRYLVEQTDIEKHLSANHMDLAVHYATMEHRFDITKLAYILERGYPRPRRSLAHLLFPSVRDWIEDNCGFE